MEGNGQEESMNTKPLIEVAKRIIGLSMVDDPW